MYRRFISSKSGSGFGCVRVLFDGFYCSEHALVESTRRTKLDYQRVGHFGFLCGGKVNFRVATLESDRKQKQTQKKSLC